MEGNQQTSTRPVLKLVTGRRLSQARVEGGALVGKDRFTLCLEGTDEGLLHRIRRIREMDAQEEAAEVAPEN